MIVQEPARTPPVLGCVCHRLALPDDAPRPEVKHGKSRTRLPAPIRTMIEAIFGSMF
jgi:hypothetical protein